MKSTRPIWLMKLTRPTLLISPPRLTRPKPTKLMKLTLRPMKQLIEMMGPKQTKTMSQSTAKADKPKLKRPKAMIWPKPMIRLKAKLWPKAVIRPKAMVRPKAKLWPKRPFGFAVTAFTPSQNILQSLQKLRDVLELL
jgi:hypothetical protein